VTHLTLVDVLIVVGIVAIVVVIARGHV